MTGRAVHPDPEGYERFIAGLAEHRRRRIDEPLVAACRGDVLEIGCGTCRLAESVAQRGCRYYGVDLAYEYLRFAAQHGRARRVCQADAECLPFADNSFDTVISGGYSCRDMDPARVCAEAGRVLRTGGRFVFDLLNRTAVALSAWRRGHVLSSEERAKFDFTTAARLRAHARAAGLAVEEVRGRSLVPLPLLSRLDRQASSWSLPGIAAYAGYDIIITLRKS